MTDFSARPGQPLDDHLDGTERRARTLSPDGTTPHGDDWETLAGVAASLHDLGKYTAAFQSYLDSDRRNPAGEEYHADAGAVATSVALGTREVSDHGALAAGLAVAYHHGGLPDFENVGKDWRGQAADRSDLRGFDLTEWRLRRIDETAPTAARERFESVADGLRLTDVRDGGVPSFENLLGKGEPDRRFYHTLVRLWGTVVCADRFDAGDVSVSPKRPLPAGPEFDFDADASGTTAEWNELKTEARRAAVETLDEAADDESLFRLTLPTGAGKTAAAVAAGAAHADRTGGRLIYALPYTTVVDQVDTELREWFDADPTDPEYTVHHHLARTWTTRDDADEPLADRTAVQHAAAWRAGVVLTTYVQLFESLVGPSAGQARKLAALDDAVIVLDEPQAIPPNWWRAVGEAIDVLRRRYDATVILTTATQPRFSAITDGPEPTELTRRDETFEFLATNERVEFVLDESVRRWVHEGADATVTAPVAARRLLDAAADDDTLAVTATVDSVADLVGAVGEVAAAESDSVDEEGSSDERTAVANLGRLLEEWYDTAGATPRHCVGGEGPDASAVAAEFLETAADELDTAESGDSGPVLVPLTAALRPVDRTVLVAALRRLLDENEETPFDDRSVLAVSTQMIEAGVDVSFDRVFRDLAPIPSLVQTAGRCNRSFGGDTGRVTVWRLAGDPIPSRTIYGSESSDRSDGGTPDRLRPTRAVLGELSSERSVLSETTVVDDLVDRYYARRHRGDEREVTDDELVDEMSKASAATLRAASMIPDDTEDVVVLRSEADRDALERYLGFVAGETDDDGDTDDETFDATSRLLDPLLARVYDSDRLRGQSGVPASVDRHGVGELPFDVVDARDDAAYHTVDGRGLR